MKKHTLKTGYTLLEVILSITLLALIALMIARIFSDSTRAVEQGKNLTLLDESARNLLDTLERDISQALIRTNVPFRVGTTVSQSGDFSTLYFVSTGMRRHLETIPRDTAPMQIKVNIDQTWNQQLLIISPDDSAGDENNNRRNLRQHSDYYFTASPGTADDFITYTEGRGMKTDEHEYTRLLESSASDYAMLSGFTAVVNADKDWTGGSENNGLPPPNDMPRFIDIQIGLVPSSVIRQARALFAAANPEPGAKLIRQNERVYTRRIFFPNTGTHDL